MGLRADPLLKKSDECSPKTHYIKTVTLYNLLDMRRKTPACRNTIHLWLWPLLVLVLGTVLFWITRLDLFVSGLFFTPGPWCGWWGDQDISIQLLHRWGEYAAYLVAAVGLMLLAGGWMKGSLRKYRRIGAFILLALILGTLTVNTLLKKHFDRPRPRDIQEFGFQETFQPVLIPGGSPSGGSFPSGHAAAGFYLIYLYFAFRDRWPRTARCFAAAGTLIGCALGFARVTQGGHFLSDVLWAFGVVYFIGYLVYRFWYARAPALSEA